MHHKTWPRTIQYEAPNHRHWQTSNKTWFKTVQLEVSAASDHHCTDRILTRLYIWAAVDIGLQIGFQQDSIHDSSISSSAFASDAGCCHEWEWCGSGVTTGSGNPTNYPQQPHSYQKLSPRCNLSLIYPLQTKWAGLYYDETNSTVVLKSDSFPVWASSPHLQLHNHCFPVWARLGNNTWALQNWPYSISSPSSSRGMRIERRHLGWIGGLTFFFWLRLC